MIEPQAAVTVMIGRESSVGRVEAQDGTSRRLLRGTTKAPDSAFVHAAPALEGVW